MGACFEAGMELVLNSTKACFEAGIGACFEAGYRVNYNVLKINNGNSEGPGSPEPSQGHAYTSLAALGPRGRLDS